MIKGLRIATIVWAVPGIIFGLFYVISPEKFISSAGYATGSIAIPYFLTYLGVAYIAFCTCLIIAARDPLRNILWIQLAMVWSFLDVLVALSFYIRGDVSLSQAAWAFVTDGIPFVALLVFYPWRKAPATDNQ
jgi:hypothetical protein